MAEAQTVLAILFADIAGSTRLYEQVGDVEAHRRVSESLESMAEAVQRHGGQVLRTVGDATLASFLSCDDALLAACSMQQAHKATPLSLRVGFHYGPVIADKGDVYGNAVNIAARVASFAKTEEITATEDCISKLQADNRERATLLDTISIKGISEPVGVYRITWEADETMHTQIASSTVASTTISSDSALLLKVDGREYKVNKDADRITIGRDQECTIAVDGDRVSRNHAQIEWAAGQLQFSDTSTNGSFIHRDGESPLFVRRETVVLDGNGKIGFGSMPNDGSDHDAVYSISDQ